MNHSCEDMALIMLNFELNPSLIFVPVFYIFCCMMVEENQELLNYKYKFLSTTGHFI